VWVPDRRERQALTHDLAMHVVAMKLFDDLLDDDSELDRYELGGCLPLWSVATERLCERAADPRAVLRVIRDDFLVVSTGQLRTKREPADRRRPVRLRPQGERAGNLGHLVHTGATSLVEVRALVDEMRALGCRAASQHSATYDVRPVVD
jgi:hypothetical protein